MKYSELGIKDLNVCRSYHCHDDWHVCEWAGLCPHSNVMHNNDNEFSINCWMALVYMENGAKIKDVVKKYHISIRQLFLYRATIHKHEAEKAVNDRKGE